MGVPWQSHGGPGGVRLSPFDERAAEEAGVRAETRRGHVPGVKTPFDSESMMPGLKSRPISEASFSQARNVIWKPPEDRTHDLSTS